jgi:glycosyltransferase involved in cell wall biosynthesis
MPVWNEAEGISDFINELSNSLPKSNIQFYIVNDCSTDNSEDQINKLKDLGFNIYLHNNLTNSGHGISTLIALRLGMASQADIVIAIDGDGQFKGSDVALVFSEISSGNFDIVEGTRINRSEPYYRRTVSFITRQLIYLRTGLLPNDANTPLRAYKNCTLRSILELLPQTTLIPNLLISAISRKEGFKIGFVNVDSLHRRGSNKQGSTWGKSISWLPSKNFFRFCIRALKEWIKS